MSESPSRTPHAANPGLAPAASEFVSGGSARGSGPHRRNPWAWIPSLYLAEGLPYVVAMTVSVIMYKGFGISNTEIALWTSWLYLPWTIKPLWSPVVDIL